LHQFAAKEAEIHAPCLLFLRLFQPYSHPNFLLADMFPNCSWRIPFCPFALAVTAAKGKHTPPPDTLGKSFT